MTQKQTVYNFLSGASVTLSNKDLWDAFSTEYPEITKGNFDFYKNKAIKENIFIPDVITGINLSTPKPNKELVFKTVNLNTVDKTRFKAISTGTPFDKIASKRDGVMPGTSYIITGESGAGKTTICTNIADYLKENNEGYTAGFISCEMDEDDWTEECIDNPRLADLQTVFMLEYLDAPNYVDILTQGLTSFNFVILDSFEVVIDQLRDVKGWTSKKAESELINILRKAAAESNCTIFAIQQYTKGGNFVGSNKIKHMLTGMAFVMFDNDGNRYITFTKNRRAGHMVGKKLYFTKNKETGRLEFDEVRFANDIAIRQFTQEEQDKIQEEQYEFDAIILDAAKEKQTRRENILAM